MLQQTVTPRGGSARPILSWVLLVVGLVISLVAIGGSQGLGSGYEDVCMAQEVPYVPPYEAWVLSTEYGSWPMGYTCVYTDNVTDPGSPRVFKLLLGGITALPG